MCSFTDIYPLIIITIMIITEKHGLENRLIILIDCSVIIKITIKY